MSKMAIDSNSKPIQVLRPNSTDTVSITASSAQSTAISAGCRVLRLVSDTDCHYTLTSGTATTSDVFLPSLAVEYVHVYEGDQVAVIRNAADGTLYVTEMI
jgi:hypothetical protein